MSTTTAIQERAPEAIMENIRGSRLATALAVAGSVVALAGGSAEKANASTHHARSAYHERPKKAQNNKAKVRVKNYPDGSSIKVVKIKAKSVGFSNKFKHCLAEAEKREQPAPPVDPYANCRGDVSVNVVARAVAKCRKGWMGGRAASRASVRQRIHVRAWSRAIASGRAEAKAETRISDRVTTRARARVDCVKLTPGQTPGNVPPENIPPENIPPQTPTKNGAEGQGSTSPGQPGGPGSGGSPGVGNGQECRNDAGDLVPGNPDQMGNC